MNLEETLASRGVLANASSVSLSQHLVEDHLTNDDETGLTASFGIAQDSLHWAQMDIVPPHDTTDVTNPGDPKDKKRRKSKAFRKYESQLIRQQDTGPRKTLVQTTGADNSDIMDVDRSSWFV